MGGTWALFDRALRRDALGLRAHIFRAVFVGILLLMLLFAHSMSLVTGAPGLNFFSMLSWLNAAAIALAGIVFFSSAVAEDKDEATLGLLQMAGISRLGLLLGKSTGYLIPGLMILAMQLPFTLLAVTLGGITTRQILAMTFAQAAGLIYIANLALFCSVVASRPATAAVWTAVLWCLSVFVPMVATGSSVLPGWLPGGAMAAAGGGRSPPTLSGQLLGYLTNSSMLARMGAILSTGFSEPVLSPQVVTNILGGVALFFAAWAALEWLPEIRLRADGLLRSSSGKTSASSSARQRVPLGAPAILWKEFQLLAGGWTRLILKTVIYAAVAGAVAWITGPALAKLDPESRAYWFVGVLLAIVTIEACWLASRILHDEVREQTLPLLLLVPIPTHRLLMAKVTGAAAALVPALVVMLTGAMLLPEGLYVLGQFLISPALWSSIVYFLFVLHFTVLMSLTFEWWWVSLGIALGACFFSWPVWFGLAAAGSASLCLIIPNTLATFGFVVWLQLGIVKAVEKSGEQ